MKILYLAILIYILQSCGGSIIPVDPIRQMKTEFQSKNQYTILLEDMDLENEHFKHKYKILETKSNGSIDVETTDWKRISDDFFLLHEDNLGMELLSKNETGKLNTIVTPPGFTNYIGNIKYGDWQLNKLGTAFIWQFNEEYSQLNKKLGIEGLEVNKNEFDEYNSKYRNNRPYYGSKIGKDSTRYGTRSHFWLISRPYFYSRRRVKNNFYKSHYSHNNRGFRGGGGFGK